MTYPTGNYVIDITFDQDTSARPMKSTLPPVIGHRGACGVAPENTLFSLRKAARLGARWVEFDAKLTRDGRVVLFHDETLDRATDGHGPVRDADLEDLAKLDAGGWFGPQFAGERIPTLDQAMALLGECGLGANVEIKPCPGRDEETARTVARLVQERWPAGAPPPLLSSFSSEALRVAAKEAPDIPRALIVGDIPRDWLRRLSAAAASALHCRHQGLRPDRLQSVLDAAVPVRCYTVNEAERARELFAMGVESVFTDFPDRIS